MNRTLWLSTQESAMERETFRVLCQRRGLGASPDDDEFSIRMAFLDVGHRLQKIGATLFFNETSYEQNGFPVVLIRNVIKQPTIDSYVVNQKFLFGKAGFDGLLANKL